MKFSDSLQVQVSALRVGDFVEVIPSFVTRGPRGGIKRYRPTRVNSAVATSTEVEEGWVELTFLSHRGVRVRVPAEHVVSGRVLDR